jgi:glyoxylase-like metal-dependent hydrolase (beta-lactamase superfamily II)
MTATWTVGDVRITKVTELELPAPPHRLLSGVDRGMIDGHRWLFPDFVDARGRALLSVHALLIETPAACVLVDTCIGGVPKIPGRREARPVPAFESRFLDVLDAAGRGVADIDVVVCTHLHFDHVGWNTRWADGGWRVVFPRARYLVTHPEWQFWRDAGGGDGTVDDSVRPVLAAGQLDLVRPDHRVCDEVRLVHTPGHTPGHVSVAIESRGDQAFITGDLIHHPLQFAAPHVGSPQDVDAAAAAMTRQAFCAERVRDNALVIGTHFAGPTAGRVEAAGPAYRFVT